MLDTLLRPTDRAAEFSSGRSTSTRAEVWQEISGWRRIWTGNGVWDTTIFFRPPVSSAG